MKHSWKRGLALLFAFILTLTLAAPALAEEPGEVPADTPVEEPVEPTPGGEEPTEPTPGGEEPAEPTPGGEEPVEPIPGGEQPVEPTPGGEEPVEPTPGGEQTPEPTPGGEQPKDPAPEEQVLKIFVSADGSEEKGDGSETAPFTTLAKAAAAANAAPDGKAEIILMTDLTSLETARFTCRDLSIHAAEGVVTVTRGEGFRPDKDQDGALYNPAMIELRSPDGTELPAGTLNLIGVILDDAQRHEGSLFDLPAAETEEPAAETEEAAPETGEPAAETEQPAAETEQAAETEEGRELETKAAPADRTDRVQDAIVSVADGGHLILGEGAELRNFGGLAAVSLGDKSVLTMQKGSAIRDTMTPDNTRGAILAAETAVVETAEGAKLSERLAPLPLPGDEPAADIKAGLTGVILTGPQQITEDGSEEYSVNYSLNFALNDKAKSLVEASQSSISGGEGTVTITLDARLTPDMSKCAFTGVVFELADEPSYDESSHKITASLRLKEDWASHLEELTNPMSFSCETVLTIQEGTSKDIINTAGEVSLTFTTSDGGSDLGPYKSTKYMQTPIVAAATSELIYDVNGGDEGSGPETEQVAESDNYLLAIVPVPTHKPLNGDAVVFIGWTLEADPHVYTYEEKDQVPQTVETVSIPAGSTVTVYALYGTDINEDGIADVRQILVTLSFDANGGEGAPEPIIHAVGGITDGELGVEIPEQEPIRDYHTFLGWGEKPDATKNDKLYKFDSDKATRRDIAVTKDTTLYAVWLENYKIIYDANGGTDAPEPTVLETMRKVKTDAKGNPVYAGQAEITSGIPVRNGYTFRGWAVTRRSGASYHAGDRVEITGGNVTLYAVWTRGANGGDGKPKTGDEGVGVYAALLSVSAFGLAATGTLLRKKRRGES